MLLGSRKEATVRFVVSLEFKEGHGSPHCWTGRNYSWRP